MSWKTCVVRFYHSYWFIKADVREILICKPPGQTQFYFETFPEKACDKGKESPLSIIIQFREVRAVDNQAISSSSEEERYEEVAACCKCWICRYSNSTGISESSSNWIIKRLEEPVPVTQPKSSKILDSGSTAKVGTNSYCKDKLKIFQGCKDTMLGMPLSGNRILSNGLGLSKGKCWWPNKISLISSMLLSKAVGTSFLI